MSRYCYHTSARAGAGVGVGGGFWDVFGCSGVGVGVFGVCFFVAMAGVVALAFGNRLAQMLVLVLSVLLVVMVSLM